MSVKAKRHIHKYHKISLGYQKIWSCASPDCSHHMPHHLEPTIVGKYSYCWQCGEQMILDPENMKDDQPICYDCKSGGKTEIDIRKLLGGK